MNKHKKKIITIAVILAIILIPTLTFTVYSYSTLKKIHKVELPSSSEDLGIDNSSLKNKTENGGQEGKKITNILLMGIDRYENASDALIVMTLDENSGKLKMTSIMRDSKVDLGKEVNKINYAYHYGGPLLTIKTINQNYMLDITDYIKLDFDAVIKVVDLMGGVEVNVTPAELEVVNYKLTTNAQEENITPTPLKKAGLQLLNGQQTAAYCRVRTVGNMDFQRTERMRYVLNALIQKFRDTSPLKYPQILSSAAPYLETSLSTGELLDLAKKSAAFSGNGVDQARLPIDGSWWDIMNEGPYVLGWDHEKNLNFLHNFIYGNTDRLGTGNK